MDNIQNETFYNKVIELFQNAKKNLSTAVNMTMVNKAEKNVQHMESIF